MNERDLMAAASRDENGWGEYRMLVMAELKRIETLILTIQKDLTLLKIDMTQYKTESRIKTGIWGLVGGLASTLSVVLIALLFHWLSNKS